MELNMTKLINIQTQIEKLQKEAAEIKTKEFQSTVHEIRAKMQAFGITVKDLQGAKSLKAAKGIKTAPSKGKSALVKAQISARVSKNPVAAKYRGPNGETWSGRGLTPRWLATLIAQGQSKEAFAINA